MTHKNERVLSVTELARVEGEGALSTERTVVPVSAPGGGRVVVIGVGNEFRRDDGAGPAVIGRLRDLVPPGADLVVTDGEPTRLMEAWTGAVLAIVVDETHLGARADGHSSARRGILGPWPDHAIVIAVLRI